MPSVTSVPAVVVLVYTPAFKVFIALFVFLIVCVVDAFDPLYVHRKFVYPASAFAFHFGANHYMAT